MTNHDAPVAPSDSNHSQLEQACYKKPFLKHVVVRIDLMPPIVGLENNIPTKLVSAVSSHFPISEPSNAISKTVKFSATGPIQASDKVFKQWNFFGRDREKQLTIASPFFTITYVRYTTYEDLKTHFSIMVRLLESEYPEVKVSRFGLRYVNVIEGIELKSPLLWNDYINPTLLGVEKFFSSPTKTLTRLMNISELKFGDVDLRFQFGMPNPDYPAIIKRSQYVLDMDAYVQTAHTPRESISHMDLAHKQIQNLFERSITEKLRKTMNAR